MPAPPFHVIPATEHACGRSASALVSESRHEYNASQTSRGSTIIVLHAEPRAHTREGGCSKLTLERQLELSLLPLVHSSSPELLQCATKWQPRAGCQCQWVFDVAVGSSSGGRGGVGHGILHGDS